MIVNVCIMITIIIMIYPLDKPNAIYLYNHTIINNLNMINVYLLTLLYLYTYRQQWASGWWAFYYAIQSFNELQCTCLTNNSTIKFDF